MSPGHGHLDTLEPSHPGNAHNAKHGIRSARLLEPRAQEVADSIMAAPHTDAMDEVGAREIGRLEARVEALDAEIDRVGMAGSGQRLKWLMDLRLRAGRNLLEALGKFGMTPYGRATWARELAQGGLAAEIATRRRAASAPAVAGTCPQTREGGAKPVGSPSHERLLGGTSS